MKTSSTSPRRMFFATALAVTGILGLSVMTASADDYVFNNGAGGDGTWEAGVGTWSDGGTQDLPWINTPNNVAVFGSDGAPVSPGGTVDVAGDVTAGYLKFNATSDVTLNGTGTITVSTGNGVLENDTNSNVTIDNNLQLDDSIDSDRFDIGDGGANTLTFNGNISYVGSNVRPSGQALIFNGGADTKFVLNGSFQGSATNPGRLILSGGTMYLNGNFANANPGNLLEVDSGNVYLGTSNLGTGGINLGGGVTTTPQLLTVGAQNITNLVTAGNYAFTDPFTSGDVVIGGSTADLSSFSTIQLIVTGLTLTAADGGRVNVGSIVGNGDISGLIKTGGGTVVLQSASTVPVTNGFNGLTPPFVSDIRQGTLLINNPSATSTFGSEGGQVRIEGGATLGGSGSTGGNQQVVAEAPALPGGPTAILAPGDAGQANLGIHPTIATLTLAGGLDAENGLTMNFKLNGDSFGGPVQGVNNDLLLVSSMTLTGAVTINLTALDTLLTGSGNIYTLVQDNGDWDGTPTSITVNAPVGYALDPTYGNGLGYVLDPTPGAGSFSVELIAVPEPSTYGLLGLGLLALVAIGRFRRLAA